MLTFVCSCYNFGFPILLEDIRPDYVLTTWLIFLLPLRLQTFAKSKFRDLLSKEPLGNMSTEDMLKSIATKRLGKCPNMDEVV